MTEQTSTTQSQKTRLWVLDILLVIVLSAGMFFRASGLLWGEYQHLHPDERFLLWVGADIQPVESFSDYFDTANSSLNPVNRGHGFYVYGTLPMFLARYLVEAIYGHSGFTEMVQVGRPLSALADMLVVLLVYLVGRRLYDRRVGILAAAFSAAAVLQIQQSHFFTMDTFINLFTLLAFYFAVRVLLSKEWQYSTTTSAEEAAAEKARELEPHSLSVVEPGSRQLLGFTSSPLFLLSLGFGIAYGMAVASKLNAAPAAVLLPAAMVIGLLSLPEVERQKRYARLIGYLVLAGVISFLVFRVFQPYAFTGPGFFDLKPDPQWLANMRTLRAQSSVDADFPPSMQWARRPIWFSGQNLVLWGLGLPLGVLAWTGFLWAGWRILTGARRNPDGRLLPDTLPEWRRHILLWSWTAVYFTWQSMALNPTMRYQLPVYPALTIFAAWAVITLYDRQRRIRHLPAEAAPAPQPRGTRILAVLVGAAVLISTYAYAFGFSRIYTRPITRVEASRWIYQNIPGPVNLRIQTGQGEYNQPLSFQYDRVISPSVPYLTSFRPQVSGQLTEVYLPHVKDATGGEPVGRMLLSISGSPGSQEPLAAAVVERAAAQGSDERGAAYTFSLDRPVTLEPMMEYYLRLDLDGGEAGITLQGAAIANEGDWDDPLPLRMDGYDAWGGIYPQGLNFNMYWEDNPDKLARFSSIMDQADTILITSSRQWGSLPRIPERFPMTTVYYRNLLGCPDERSIEWCYNVAEPGMFEGRLGFDLIETFQSNPSIGPVEINDQFAEEAFTVYDHPKVFVFQKNEAYNTQQVLATLGSVDFTKVVNVPPLKAKAFPANLMLPAEQFALKRQSGTWSDLFDTQAVQNRYPALGAVLWYLSLFLLGLLVYPVLRLAFPGLADRGYPVARTAGLLILAYLAWLAGSFNIPFTRLTISIAAGLIALVGGILAFRQRTELWQELKSKPAYFLVIEGLFLAFFVFDLLIRIGNPDLWHPYKGGEKPMDFAYFNAVLKSSTFPPYDPWFAGGYLNYYYFGFVFIGAFVKWLGIVPAVAYNLILPTIFSMIAVGAFSIAWNLFSGEQRRGARLNHTAAHAAGDGAGMHAAHLSSASASAAALFSRKSPFWAGIAAALGMAVLGNLGTVKMIYEGYQKLVAPNGVIEGAGLLTRWVWAVRGFVRVLGGESLRYGIGDWYWNPSRAIPAPNEVEPITEFPFFTVLYGDPHAHLFALPVTLLALTFMLAFVLGRGRWKSWTGGAAAFLIGGLAVGVLRPTNTWDFYPYLALGAVAVGYTLWFHDKPSPRSLAAFARVPGVQRFLAALGGTLLFVALAFVLYQPYVQWYGQGYNEVQVWNGTHTPITAYLVHWGLFLFVIASWMFWETYDWMAKTPLSALQKLNPYQYLIQAAGLLLAGLLFGIFLFFEAPIVWIALPLAAWAGVLILRPDQPHPKRFVLFLIGTGLALTLMVEIIVLKGDIARMNTVFKFYLQVWTLLAVSAGAAFGWLLMALRGWLPGWRHGWQMALAVLVAGAALYPLLAGTAKVRDRMVAEAPHTLDGMLYMNYAHYNREGEMDLSQDYRAIRWMQENVAGSPVIVEANLRDLYQWGSRYSIYTGLPSVVGWEWHQQQQRALVPGSWVSERIAEVDAFYNTTDLAFAESFINKYDVGYIVIGQLERNHYPGPGLEKFDTAEGMLWREVYRDADTVIYEASG